MHGRLYNQLDLEIAIIPQTPLLIKSGQKASIDPALPDMQFVRTRRRRPNGDINEVVYIPGSSLRGVVRAHAERLLRTINKSWACYSKPESPCYADKIKHLKEEDKDKPENQRRTEGNLLYLASCYACKLFGNTGIATRLFVNDLYPANTEPVLSETRYAVAIDRITGGVAAGPFDLEVVTHACFAGHIILRNFTVGQLGLLSAVLLDISDGFVAMGHSKSRGLGRVKIEFTRAQFRFATSPENKILGIGAIASKMDSEVALSYKLLSSDELSVENFQAESDTVRYYFVESRDSQQIQRWLASTTSRWIEEAQNAG